MPNYFAYGANLDKRAMAIRCPGARPLGVARLEDHRLIIMRDGVASVRTAPGEVVHGLLWALELSDVGPLDVFEDLAAGLYTKTVRPVLHEHGSTPAFLYVGHTNEEGPPLPGYLPVVLEAAREIGLPLAYLRKLEALGALGTRPGRFDNEAPEAPAGPLDLARGRRGRRRSLKPGQGR